MSHPTKPSPAEILQRFYDAESIYMGARPEERDISGMGAHVSPEFQLHQSPDLPYGGVYEGIEGFQRWSEAMFSYFDSLEVVDPQVFEKEGSDTVIVYALLKLRVRKTQKPLVKPLTQVVRVDRTKEVLLEMRPFYWDVRSLNEAVEES